MGARLLQKPIYCGILFGALCNPFGAHAQTVSQHKSSATSSTVQYPDTVELDPFGGVSLWGIVNGGSGEKLRNGGTAGGRVTWNFSRHFGLEFGYNFMVNNVELVTPVKPGLQSYIFGNQIHYWAVNPVFSLRPRGSRVQPFLTAGAGMALYKPTAAAETYAENPSVNAIYGSAPLTHSLEPLFNYGGGVKFHLSDYLGLRFDARGEIGRNPTFGLQSPSSSTALSIPNGKLLRGFQATMGLVLYLGQVQTPPAPPLPPVRPLSPLNMGSITGAEGTLCFGRSITLHATATDPAGHPLAYSWKLNGAQAGTNSSDFSFTPDRAGDFTIEVTASDVTNPSRSVTAGPRTIAVQELTPPQITSIAAIPGTLTCAADPNGAHAARLSVVASPSACASTLNYKWTVTEGSVADAADQNANFNAGTLNFVSGTENQTKTVTATVVVSDENGKTASQSTPIVVNCPPQWKRLPDIVFSKNNARVNNCGKRILIDDAAPQSGTYDIVLVGHRAGDESTFIERSHRGRGPVSRHTLDQQRALNAAAVLTGGHGTCASVDPAHVKIDWVGTEQTSQPEPGLCGTSNLPPAQRERHGSEISATDQERRVEVYLIPRGSTVTPPAVKNLKLLPEREVRALGCPR